MRHPNTILRQALSSVLIYSPEAYIQQWMEHDLLETGLPIQCAKRFDGVLAALVTDPPPRPQVLVIDIDAPKLAEIARLVDVRCAGWRGKIIGVGERRVDLLLDQRIEPPFRTGDLRAALLDRLPVRGKTVHQHRTRPIDISSLRDQLG